MSIDYTGVQEHKYTVSSGTTADAEIARFWSKSFQWRIIGLDVLVITAGTAHNGFELYDVSNTAQLLAVDAEDGAAGTMVSDTVDADDQVVAVGDIIALREDYTDGTAEAQVVVTTSRTTA